MTPGPAPTMGKLTNLDGAPVLELKDGTGSAYVTISAEPEFLELDAPGNEVLTFSRYNAPAVITPPPPGQVISLPGI